MVNKNEKQIVEKYEREGWRTLRGGAPDFLFLKVNDGGEIKDFKFVEVKSDDGELTYEQRIYRKILERLGAKYKIETIHPKRLPTNPNHAIRIEMKPSEPKRIEVNSKVVG